MPMSALPQDLTVRLKAVSDDPLLEQFSELLFEKASPELLDAVDPGSLAELAAESLKLLRTSGGRAPHVQIINPDEQLNPFTVVLVALSDRPFIVDSVKAEIRRQGFELAHVLHPVYAAARDADGVIDRLSRPGTPQLSENIAFELYFIERESDEQRLEELHAGVSRVLRDVVRATDAYESLQQRAVAAAARLRERAGVELEQSEELLEYASFLDWLIEDNFVFLGYREYDITEIDGAEHLSVTEGSGLGILGDQQRSAYREPVKLSDITPALRERVTGGPVLIVTKTNAESTVHRPVRMDYIGVKKLDECGAVRGERRFLGLFTSRALSTPVSAIPILRRKLRQVLELDGASRGSHDYKQIVSIFDSLPREELFWSDARQLLQDIRTIMSMDEERTVRLAVRPDPLGRGIGIIVIMPRDRFNAIVRRRVQRFLTSALKASHTDFQLTLGEDEEQARLHFFFTTELAPAEIDAEALERHVTDLSRSWAEDLRERLVEAHGRKRGRELAARYTEAFSERFIADTPARTALADIAELEALENGQFRVALQPPQKVQKHRPHALSLRIWHEGRGLVLSEVLPLLANNGLCRLSLLPPSKAQMHRPHALSLLIWHAGRGLVLSEVLPLLENTGLRVLQQTAYSVSPDGGARELAIESFLVEAMDGRELPRGADAERLVRGLEQLLQKEAEDDGLNALLLYTSLDLSRIALLRAYAMYYSQVKSATSRSFLEATLVRQSRSAEALWNYFAARFDPAGPDIEARREPLQQLADAFLDTLSAVSSLAEDTALRGMFDLMQATVRTNYFLGLPRISFKIDSHAVSDMPAPRPRYEIGVASPDMEGTHLRGGLVARGGVRWSDRHDDFRSEVLDLMKTQMTKNAVIVPVGSKGGFVIKNAPADRPALLEHVRQQYQTYVRGLLDLTDNIKDGEVQHPEGIVRWDGPDTYLVVAADKGTATFSDLANATAAEYGFWLGDAFASGGSHGYDHKKQGITARGAWQTVSRHFRELGIDVKTDEFTAAGIGDMAGDVFGNGMLYTDKLRLQAAFNHLHIFLDPDPDAARSYEERRRLFTTPGSSWLDYNAELISEGGGVFERAAKSIPLSPQVKAMLDVDADSLSGQELIRAILRMPVDLLWNGGIGTYVKASSESHADARDSAHDSVRLDGNELRARVVGEGGNLGFTQLGRIEYARNGGRINTDAIDNSGGVDLSDHEVNIKILLEAVVAEGRLTVDERNQLLEDMTDEAVGLVLQNNYSQSLALSLAEPRSARELNLFSSLQEYLAERGDLDPRVEHLPTARQLQELARNRQGYSRPELAILLAYVKMGLYRRLLETDFPEEPHFAHYLLDYFPATLVERFREQTLNHSLRREITATQFTNRVVDLLGISFVHRLLRSEERRV